MIAAVLAAVRHWRMVLIGAAALGAAYLGLRLYLAEARADRLEVERAAAEAKAEVYRAASEQTALAYDQLVAANAWWERRRLAEAGEGEKRATTTKRLVKEVRNDPEDGPLPALLRRDVERVRAERAKAGGPDTQ